MKEFCRAVEVYMRINSQEESEIKSVQFEMEDLYFPLLSSSSNIPANRFRLIIFVKLFPNDGKEYTVTDKPADVLEFHLTQFSSHKFILKDETRIFKSVEIIEKDTEVNVVSRAASKDNLHVKIKLTFIIKY